MWCHHCQQDVPAARSAPADNAACPRCRRPLRRPSAAGRPARWSDSGIDLSLYPAIENEPPVASPADLLDSGDALRRLVRKLDSRELPSVELLAHRRFDLETGSQSVASAVSSAGRSAAVWRTTSREPASDAGGHAISALLAVGAAGISLGVAVLTASAVNAERELWQWGFAAAAAGQGVLALGLAWMAGRLWRNSRRLNQQLASVEDRIEAVAERTVAPFATSTLASLHEYHRAAA